MPAAAVPDLEGAAQRGRDRARPAPDVEHRATSVIEIAMLGRKYSRPIDLQRVPGGVDLDRGLLAGCGHPGG
jgi:hypothetical protein